MSNLTDRIIFMANKIYNKLGSGHTESVYHRAMEVELRLNGLKYESEVVTPIYYEGHYIGYGRADIIVNRGSDEPIVIELKALSSTTFKSNELSRLRTYMKGADIPHGIMVNFPQISGKETCNFDMVTF